VKVVDADHLPPTFRETAMPDTCRYMLALLTLSLSLAACGDPAGDEPTPTRDAGEPGDTQSTEPPPHDDDACSEFVVPTRLGFRWKALNHRFSAWNQQLDRDGDRRCRAETLEVDHVGGDFSDGNDEVPRLKYGFRERTGPGPTRVGVARRTIEVSIDTTGVATGSQTLARSDLNLRNYRDVVALVEGFGFQTDVEQSDAYPDDYDPAQGYTMRGIGASVEASADRETVELDYRLRVEPGTSPDREPHNRAVPHARLQGRLGVLLVGVSDTPVATGSVAYSYQHDKPAAFEEDDFSPAARGKQLLTLQGDPEAGRGVFGIRSFDIELTPDLACSQDGDCPAGETCRDDGSCTEELGEPGFYLRELTVDLSLESFDESTGEANFLFDGYASNASQAVGFWSMQADVSGDVAWLQTGGSSETHRWESDFETGSTSFELDAMEE
jgi:predicted small lipoprotein YifL